MKTGRTLQELAAEITRQAESKRDFVASTAQLAVADDGKTLTLDGQGDFAMRDLTLQQIAGHTGIPVPYMRRMQNEAPALLARNANHWLRGNPTPRLVRTLDGEARAFLSNRYQRVDNLEVAETVLPVLQEVGQKHGGLQIASCEVTENRLFLKAVFPQIAGEITKSRQVGDVVQSGIMISNSEVGLGAVSIKPFSLRLICLNGMTRDQAKRWAHVGRRISEGEEVYELLSDEAKQADDRALLLKVRDTVAAMVDPARFAEWLDRMNDATQVRIDGDVNGAIEVLGKNAGLNGGERSGILSHLIEGGDLSKWGLANAVTALANTVESYDRASELEVLGGRIIDLAAGEWKEIAQAAKPARLAA